MLTFPIKLSLYIGLPSLAIIIYYFKRNKKHFEGKYILLLFSLLLFFIKLF
jgi:hypothetical protein